MWGWNKEKTSVEPVTDIESFNGRIFPSKERAIKELLFYTELIQLEADEKAQTARLQCERLVAELDALEAPEDPRDGSGVFIND